MGSRTYYYIFKLSVQILIKILITSIVAGLLSTFLDGSFWGLFVIVFIAYLFIESTFAMMVCTNGYKDLLISHMAENLFNKLYEREFENYEYKVKEKVLNDGTKIYYPLVKTNDHYPWYYIKHDSVECWLDLKECAGLNSNEEALFIIKRYMQQTQERIDITNGKEIKEENFININFGN